MPKNFFKFPTLFVSKLNNKSKAFTLVEILVVVAILAALSALVISAINPVHIRRAARDSARQKDLALIGTALEQYYSDNNTYPPSSLACLDEYLTKVNTSCAGTAAGTVYIRNLPKTQTAVAAEYCYTLVNSQTYSLCAPTEAETTTSTMTNPAPCTPTAPTGLTTLGTDFGSTCITNPF